MVREMHWAGELMSRVRPATLALPLLFLAQACAASPCAAAPRHDEPVAPDEPRALLEIRLDLPKAATCEEAFDLALYESRAVDRIDWEGSSQKCAGRRARIRYMPRRIARDELLKLVQSRATKVEVLSP